MIGAPQHIELPGAQLSLWPRFWSASEAAAHLEGLREELAWRSDEVRVFGRSHPIPRLHAWYGDPGVAYRWSGLRMQAAGWTPRLERLREAVARAAELEFNSLLANLYRDGRDSMGWHADDEPELGPAPIIASASFGATRDFVLRPKAGGERVVLPLESGSLLLMRGDTQRHWQHALPKRLRVHEARVNLTFRRVRTDYMQQ